jgi:adenine-specific DNA-methyltransferase
MIKYLGSKRLLVPRLVELIGSLDAVRSILDVFSGTARVGHALKSAGYRVAANDHNAYAHVLAQCYVQADAGRVRARAERLLGELQTVPARPGFITATYCEQSRFFQPKNGARIDAIRDRIEALDLEPDLKAIALVSLMEAADRVDSTTGVQMAYLKSWAPRAHNDLELRMPKVLDGPGSAHDLDALEFASKHSADLVYLDPPYNQHNFLRNYHIWETLVRWDAPEVYGVACKRADCRERTSAFNSKRKIHAAMWSLMHHIDARYVLVSFNNEGYISREEMQGILAAHGEVEVHEMNYGRYVGAKIGIYNPDGKKVGKISHLTNIEYLFLVRMSHAHRRR